MSDENPWGPDVVWDIGRGIGRALGPSTAADGSKVYVTGSSPYSTPTITLAEPGGDFTQITASGVREIGGRAGDGDAYVPTDADISSQVTANTEYWENLAREAREGAAYSPATYNAANRVLDKYEQDYKQILGGPTGLSAQVEGAFGAAAGRQREGAQNIYQGGQRAAGAIDALYGGAAARAEGLAAGQGAGPATALSGLTPVSGDMAYMPSVTRAYGATAADYTGASATLSSRDLAASRAGQGRRMTLDEWANSQMLGIRMRLDMAHETAAAAAGDAQKAAEAAVRKQEAADKFTGTQAQDVIKFMERLWDDGSNDNPVVKNVKEQYNNDKEAFMAAVRARLEVNSKRMYQQYWQQYTVGNEMLGMAPLFGGGPGSIF